MTPRPDPGESSGGNPPAAGHYFSPTPDTASRPSRATLALPDLTVELATDRGVFSAERVDSGTKTLLVEMSGLDDDRWPGGDLVDLGCGYGPIAMALALRHRSRTVWAVDRNERARDLCAANAAALGVGDRVRVVAPGGVPGSAHVAAVVSNPPIRIGKTALHQLLSEWLDRLVPGGEAWLVVQRNLGADSLARWLGERGHGVRRVASRRGYRVLVVGGSAPAAGGS